MLNPRNPNKNKEFRNNVIMRHYRNGVPVAEIVRRMNNAIWPFITEETVRGVVYAYRNAPQQGRI